MKINDINTRLAGYILVFLQLKACNATMKKTTRFKLFTYSKTPVQQTYLALYMLLGAIMIGVVGFMLIENYSLLDAFYMTVITLGTVGFSEVYPLSDAGKIFTIFLIISGLVIFGFFITQISRYVLDGEFVRNLKLYKMKKHINSLHQHTIICGFGRNGREAARVLKKINTEIVIIENDVSKLHNYPENDDYLFLSADSTRDESLINAGILNAKAIITTLPDDALNVFVCLTAKELNPNIKIISRATHVSSIKKLKNAGANNVIMPDKIGGAHMAMLVNNPDIEEFIDIMSTTTGEDFMIQEILSTRDFIIGDIDCWRITGASIIGLKSAAGKFIINPAPTEKISNGDAVIIMGSKQQIELSYSLFK